jgi:hypothetical protein
MALTRYRRTPWYGYRGPGFVSSRGLRVRQVGLIGGEILPAHGYRDGGRDWCRLLPDLVFLGWWTLLFSQDLWGYIWYGVGGSPVDCR